MKKQITIQGVRRKTSKEELRGLWAFFEEYNEPLSWRSRKLLVVMSKVNLEKRMTQDELIRRLAKVAGIHSKGEAKRCYGAIRKVLKEITGVDEDGGRFSVMTTSMGDDPAMYEYKDANIGVDRRGDEYIRRQSHLDKTDGEHFQRGVNWW